MDIMEWIWLLPVVLRFMPLRQVRLLYQKHMAGTAAMEIMLSLRMPMAHKLCMRIILRTWLRLASMWRKGRQLPQSDPPAAPRAVTCILKLEARRILFRKTSFLTHFFVVGPQQLVGLSSIG